MRIKSVQNVIDKLRKKTGQINTLHYIIAMLKEYGIKDIVTSPGAQNANFNFLVQKDAFFNCYSVVDERSAAYVASGIAFERNCPVVITCTEATSSRNYLSAMTEAYYRKVPIIALTFYNSGNTNFSLGPQHIDRSISQNDVKTISVELPEINDKSSASKCLMLLNAALATASYKNEPVHINCSSYFEFDKFDYDLSKIKTWKTQYYYDIPVDLKKELDDKNIAVFIGSHNKFSSDVIKAIENFAKSWNAPVFCDHTSNYNGENAILISKAANQINLSEFADILIDMGGICGDYTSGFLYGNASIWRLIPDGNFSCRFSHPTKKHFICSEKTFFESLYNDNYKVHNYYELIKEKIDNIELPKLPMSNLLVCKYLSKYIPTNSTLNVSILNSLRSMNYFDIDKSIASVCNVGGFGIDGQLSTLIGMSFASPEKLHFGVFGDLSFFYDMNILGNRSLKSNIRIIIINNNRGEEFRLIPDIEENLHDEADVLIAAGGHYKSGAKNWAEACGFEYMSSLNSDNLENDIKHFCCDNFDKPVLFEVFTTNENEKTALYMMKNCVK